MKPLILINRKQLGFTLIELMMVSAIIGVLAMVAVPYFTNYAKQAQVTEGVLLLGELRRRVEITFNRQQGLTAEIPSSPPSDGQLFGGPYYSYSTLFGTVHNMWEQIEYQPRGPHRILILRAYRKPEWDNSDIGLNLQIKLRADGYLDFRCVVDDDIAREQWAPASCRDGTANDWSW